MYWSGERLWEGCGGVWRGVWSVDGCGGGVECGMKEWRREWGAMLCTLYSVNLKSYSTSVFLGSY